jgi:hypothetical protein
MSRGVELVEQARASGPSIMYFISGETSISATASRIAQYSRSTCRS